GLEGDRKFSSGAQQIAEAVNRHPNISIDVGQIMFGQTVTESGDSMRQYAGHPFGYPKKHVIMDIECDAGCGVVPFKYKDQNFVNALQWAIGLELFLSVSDPWRIFLTTDHPNGAPFTSYPHLIRLLMDRTFRREMLATILPEAAAASVLGALDREYSLYEIAIVTRAAPARSLGLNNLGHLGIGARGDITVYTDNPNRERMFGQPRLVFKAGELIVRDGKIVATPRGLTHVTRPEFDPGIERVLDDYFDQYMTVRRRNFMVSDAEIEDLGQSPLQRHTPRVRA
ncbi:MAG: amidohydrolase family protein, partial [Gammaproteobacteria bacterium]